MIDPIAKLADIYPTLENGHKAAAREVKEAVLEMQATIADLESALARQPLPEAPASLTAKVIDRNTQIEWLVTVREAGRAKLLIQAMPLINEWLAEQGLIAMDVYSEERRRLGVPEGVRAALPTPVILSPLPPGPSPITSASHGPSAASEGRPLGSASNLSFNAETLTKSTEGDKTYYKVKGGQFSQYGVTIWPEALAEAGFDLDTLAGVTNLSGYTAYYVLNDKGKPGKVVGLGRG